MLYKSTAKDKRYLCHSILLFSFNIKKKKWFLFISFSQEILLHVAYNYPTYDDEHPHTPFPIKHIMPVTTVIHSFTRSLTHSHRQHHHHVFSICHWIDGMVEQLEGSRMSLWWHVYARERRKSSMAHCYCFAREIWKGNAQHMEGTNQPTSRRVSQQQSTFNKFDSFTFSLSAAT